MTRVKVTEDQRGPSIPEAYLDHRAYLGLASAVLAVTYVAHCSG
jgi:hypothetical protein